MTIDNVRFEQNGPADGAVLPGAQFGQFDVAVNVPVGLSFDLEAGPILGGGVTPVGPVPVVLPLVVTVDRADCESLLSGSASESFSQSIPSPFPFAFDDLPFDLPTLLPPGGTANLLLSASLDGISLDGSVSLLVGAVSDDARVEDVCPGVANSTGFGADIAVVGSTSVANADMGLQVTGLPANTFGMLIMSRSQAFVPGFGGSQGDLCVGEPCYRYFDSVTGSGPAGEITVFPDFDALPQAQPSSSWRRGTSSCGIATATPGRPRTPPAPWRSPSAADPLARRPPRMARRGRAAVSLTWRDRGSSRSVANRRRPSAQNRAPARPTS